MADDTLRDPRWTDETRDVVARQLHGLLCIERDWDRCNLHGQHWGDARTILAALADAGLLLPAGTVAEQDPRDSLGLSTTGEEQR